MASTRGFAGSNAVQLKPGGLTNAFGCPTVASPREEAAMADDTIIRIDTVRWEAQPNVCWVRVHTAGDHVGLGETYYLPGAIESVVHDLAAGLLLGAPAGRRTGHLADLFACANFSGFAG